MPPTTKTVKVRVPVFVNEDGQWYSPHVHFEHLDKVHEPYAGSVRYWLTAELAIPTVPEVQAEAEASQ